MSTILLSPPLAFIIIVLVGGLSLWSSKILAPGQLEHPSGGRKAYACGQDVPTHRLRPNYSEFFPFAFFFTVMHVAGMIVATIPNENTDSLMIAILYSIAAVIGMVILFRR
jgi:hypothetical protein